MCNRVRPQTCYAGRIPNPQCCCEMDSMSAALLCQWDPSICRASERLGPQTPITLSPGKTPDLSIAQGRTHQCTSLVTGCSVVMALQPSAFHIYKYMVYIFCCRLQREIKMNILG